MRSILAPLCFFCLLAPARSVLAPVAVPQNEAVVMVVDPSWDDVAAYVDRVPLLQRYKIVKVMNRPGMSHAFTPGHITPYGIFTYSSTDGDTAAATKEICPQLKAMDVHVAAVVPTSDGAVALTDMLAHCLGVRGNAAFGPLAAARRDKWIMGESIKNAGLRSVRQKKVSSWAAAEAYLKSWDPPLSHDTPCVFKILAGSGGEGDAEVHSLEQAKAYWYDIHGSVDIYADVNKEILIQEYLKGKEYAVDSVSRDGVHKVVAVWLEDFRPANGIFDQYFGFKLLDPADPLSQKIIDYSNKVLDATGLRNGAANTEVKWLEDEDQPCLVEVNARWAGVNWGDALAVEQACVGQDQITAAFDCYLDQDAFDSMPAYRPLIQNGAVVFTINYEAGILTAIPGLAAAKSSPSYLNCDIDSATGEAGMMGKELPLTTPNSIPINIALANKDAKVVDADYQRLILLQEKGGFFSVTPRLTPPAVSLSAGRLGRKGFEAENLPVLFATLALGVAAMVLIAASASSSRRQVSDPMDWYTSVE